MQIIIYDVNLWISANYDWLSHIISNIANKLNVAADKWKLMPQI